MTNYVDPDPMTAIELMLKRLDSGAKTPQLYASAREGGLVELLLIVGLQRYGSAEEFATALRFFANAIELGDLEPDLPDDQAP